MEGFVLDRMKSIENIDGRRRKQTGTAANDGSG
jgi:hypothetical protein